MGSKTTIWLVDANGNSTGQTLVIDTRDLADAQNDALNRLANQFSLPPGGEGAKIDAGFNYQSKNFQIDATSRQNINGAATMAMAAAAAQQSFSIIWVASDNSTVTLDGPGMIAFGAAVGSYYSALFAAYQTLKAEIAALTDIPSCDAFDVTQGWPSN